MIPSTLSQYQALRLQMLRNVATQVRVQARNLLAHLFSRMPYDVYPQPAVQALGKRQAVEDCVPEE